MIKTILKAVEVRWKSYRHRFVPWIALNIQKNERTLRQVKGRSKDKVIDDKEVCQSLLQLFTALLKNDLKRQEELISLLPVSSQKKYQSIHDTAASAANTGCGPGNTMFNALGFSIERRPSLLQSAGTGVFVAKGTVPKGVTVAMYPGTIYQVYEPILIQSIRNPFVFRCIDRVLIDGNDKGISKIVFRSCSGRDRLGPFKLSGSTWLTANPENPLAVGQYVNNCSNEMSANVCYQEFDVPKDFPLELRQFLPNVNYQHDDQRPLRCVVLVSLRQINCGEELFSNYYTIVH